MREVQGRERHARRRSTRGQVHLEGAEEKHRGRERATRVRQRVEVHEEDQTAETHLNSCGVLKQKEKSSALKGSSGRTQVMRPCSRVGTNTRRGREAHTR